jgi:undecaprenyl-diphosphatase
LPHSASAPNSPKRRRHLAPVPATPTFIFGRNSHRRAFVGLYWVVLARLRSSLQRAGLLESAVLIALLVIAGSVWIFVETADEVREGESQRFDEWTLRALRGPDGTSPIGPRWFVHVARDFTALGSAAVITLVTIGATGFLALTRKWGALALVIALVAGGAIASTLLKRAFDRARPELSLHLAEVNSLSFPSGHSMLAAVTYFTLGALLARTTADRRIKAYFLTSAALLALIIGATRIYLGVHFPTDVLAGWCAGMAWALLCSLIARWLQRKGVVEMKMPPDETR